MSRDIFHQTRLPRAPSNRALNTARQGAATASLGSLGQCFTTFMVKNFFLISNLNLPSFSLEPFPLVLSLYTLRKAPLHPSCRPLQALKGCYKVTPESSLLQAEQPQFSQPVLIGKVLQPSDHLCGPPLDPLQHIHVLLMLVAPELDAVLQVGSQESGVKRHNHLPRPAGHASLDAAQDTVGFLGCKRTLLAHVELCVHQYPQVLLRAALEPLPAQPVLVFGIAHCTAHLTPGERSSVCHQLRSSSAHFSALHHQFARSTTQGHRVPLIPTARGAPWQPGMARRATSDRHPGLATA